MNLQTIRRELRVRGRGFLGFAIALLATSAPVTAQELRFQRLTVEDGLAHATVWRIHQDSRGFLWIAAESSARWSPASPNGKISGRDGAAALLGMKPSTLDSRMKTLGIKKR